MEVFRVIIFSTAQNINSKITGSEVVQKQEPIDTAEDQERFTVKVNKQVKVWLEDERYRRKKLSGKKYTENELIQELIDTHLEKPLAIRLSKLDNTKLPEDLRRLMAMLIGFFTSAKNSQDLQILRGMRAIQHNIEWFYGSVGDPNRVQPIEVEFIPSTDSPRPRKIKTTSS